MARYVTLVLLVVAFLCATPVSAQDLEEPELSSVEVERSGIGVALRASTLGAGIEVSKPITGRLSARVGANYFAYSLGMAEDVNQSNFSGSFDIDGSVDMFSASLLADFYPFKKVLRLSAGLVYNGNSITVGAVASDSIRVEMNNQDVYRDASEVGDLGVAVSWKKLRPYVGLGLGNAAVGNRVDLLFDLGLIYAGGPQVEIETTEGSMLERNRENGPVITQNLAANILYRWYPVVALGFSVRI